MSGGTIIACPSCGQRNRVPDGTGGRTVRCGRCRQELGGTPVMVTDADFDSVLRQHPRLMVDFWAAWCGPCRVVAPILEEIARSSPAITVAKLDIDANQQTAARFNVSSIPTIVFFREGREVGREVGAQPKARLEFAMNRWFGA